MIDPSGGFESRTQAQLPPEYEQRAGTQRDTPIHTGLRAVPLYPGDSCSMDVDNAVREIEIGEHQGDLLRGTQAGEESKFVVIALRLAPVAMDCRNQCFGVLDREGIDSRSIVLTEASAAQASRRVVSFRMVAVAEVEGAPNDADAIVVRLLAPALSIRDFDERRVTHLMKQLSAEPGTPDPVQYSSIGHERCGSQVFLGEARFTMREEIVEHVVAGADSRAAINPSQETIVRKLFGEGEGADFHLLLDGVQARARATQIRLRRRPLNRRAVPNALVFEIELDSSARRGTHAAREPFAAHKSCSKR